MFVLILVAIYLGFNLIVGILGLLPLYLYKERGIPNAGEFALLALAPFIGLGNWLYNKAARSGTSPLYPQRWYVWKQMATLNLALIIGGWITVLLIMPAYESAVGGGMEWAEDQENPAAAGFGILADMTIGVFEGLVGIIAIMFSFIMTIFLLFLLVYIPRKQARTIQLRFLKEESKSKSVKEEGRV